MLYSINLTLVDYREGLHLGHRAMRKVVAVLKVIQRAQHQILRRACDSTGWLEEPKVTLDEHVSHFYCFKGKLFNFFHHFKTKKKISN